MSDGRTDPSVDDVTPVVRLSVNEAIARRWDDLRAEGRHGVFETLFLIAKEQRAASHIAGLREAVEIVEGLRKRICDGGDLEENSVLLKPINAIHRRISELENPPNPLTNQVNPPTEGC